MLIRPLLFILFIMCAIVQTTSTNDNGSQDFVDIVVSRSNVSLCEDSIIELPCNIGDGVYEYVITTCKRTKTVDRKLVVAMDETGDDLVDDWEKRIWIYDGNEGKEEKLFDVKNVTDAWSPLLATEQNILIRLNLTDKCIRVVVSDSFVSEDGDLCGGVYNYNSTDQIRIDIPSADGCLLVVNGEFMRVYTDGRPVHVYGGYSIQPENFVDGSDEVELMIVGCDSTPSFDMALTFKTPPNYTEGAIMMDSRKYDILNYNLYLTMWIASPPFFNPQYKFKSDDDIGFSSIIYYYPADVPTSHFLFELMRPLGCGQLTINNNHYTNSPHLLNMTLPDNSSVTYTQPHNCKGKFLARLGDVILPESTESTEAMKTTEPITQKSSTALTTAASTTPAPIVVSSRNVSLCEDSIMEIPCNVGKGVHEYVITTCKRKFVVSMDERGIDLKDDWKKRIWIYDGDEAKEENLFDVKNVTDAWVSLIAKGRTILIRLDVSDYCIRVVVSDSFVSEDGELCGGIFNYNIDDQTGVYIPKEEGCLLVVNGGFVTVYTDGQPVPVYGGYSIQKENIIEGADVEGLLMVGSDALPPFDGALTFKTPQNYTRGGITINKDKHGVVNYNVYMTMWIASPTFFNPQYLFNSYDDLGFSSIIYFFQADVPNSHFLFELLRPLGCGELQINEKHYSNDQHLLNMTIPDNSSIIYTQAHNCTGTLLARLGSVILPPHSASPKSPKTTEPMTTVSTTITTTAPNDVVIHKNIDFCEESIAEIPCTEDDNLYIYTVTTCKERNLVVATDEDAFDLKQDWEKYLWIYDGIPEDGGKLFNVSNIKDAWSPLIATSSAMQIHVNFSNSCIRIVVSDSFTDQDGNLCGGIHRIDNYEKNVLQLPTVPNCLLVINGYFVHLSINGTPVPAYGGYSTNKENMVDGSDVSCLNLQASQYAIFDNAITFKIPDGFSGGQLTINNVYSTDTPDDPIIFVPPFSPLWIASPTFFDPNNLYWIGDRLNMSMVLTKIAKGSHSHLYFEQLKPMGCGHLRIGKRSYTESDGLVSRLIPRNTSIGYYQMDNCNGRLLAKITTVTVIPTSSTLSTTKGISTTSMSKISTPNVPTKETTLKTTSNSQSQSSSPTVIPTTQTTSSIPSSSISSTTSAISTTTEIPKKNSSSTNQIVFILWIFVVMNL